MVELDWLLEQMLVVWNGIEEAVPRIGSPTKWVPKQMEALINATYPGTSDYQTAMLIIEREWEVSKRTEETTNRQAISSICRHTTGSL